MSTHTDWFDCPKCGKQAHRDQDTKTCEVTFGCSGCDWNGENVEQTISELKFTCPKCNHNELGSVEQCILTYPITKIPDNGDLDYDTDNPTSGDSQVLAYQCMNCGYELKDKDNDTIDDYMEVVEWIKNNIPEKADD